MQQTRTAIPGGHQAPQGRAKKPKDIYLLADRLPRQTRSNPRGFSYDEMLKYGTYLYRFIIHSMPFEMDRVDEANDFHEKDTLVKAIDVLESELKHAHFNIDDFKEKGVLKVSEAIAPFQGQLYNFEMGFVDIKIHNNLKIGMALVYDHILSYFGWVMNKNLGEQYCTDIFDRHAEWLIEDYESEENENRDFVLDVKAFKILMNDIVRKFVRLKNSKFDFEKKYKNLEYEKIHHLIIEILRFDMCVISDFLSNKEEDESLMLDQIFFPEFDGLNKLGDMVSKNNRSYLSDVGNSVGQECLWRNYTITEHKVIEEKHILLDKVEKFEKNLNLFFELTNKYYENE